MAVAGGVAVLAVAAGLMSPPPAPVVPAGLASARMPAARTASADPAPARLAQPPAPPVPNAGPAAPATPAPVAPPPIAETDTTAVLAQAVPQRVPLARDQRDPTAMARLEAAAAAPPAPPPPVSQAQSAEPRTDLPRARVGEVDLGLRLMPGSKPLPDSGRRVPDGAGGEALALSLAGSGTLDAAVQFYRQQLVAEGLPADAVQVLRPGDGQALLRAQSPQGGEQTVWIVQNGPALDIVLARVRPGPAALR